nr:immunoglobulin heavy chain junction region [Mus musculus]
VRDTGLTMLWTTG